MSKEKLPIAGVKVSYFQSRNSKGEWRFHIAYHDASRRWVLLPDYGDGERAAPDNLRILRYDDGDS